MKRWLTLSLSLSLSLLMLGSVAHAQDVVKIDYLGYGWESGGLPPSGAGDVLKITAIADDIDPLFGVDLGTEEVTLYLYDLVSGGETDLGGGVRVIEYAGGMIDVYADPLMNHDWGINPPNPLLPTFTDGTLLLAGEFTDFTLVLFADDTGSYNGNIDGIGGTMAEACEGCAYTFGGAFGKDSNPEIPEGYDLFIDGVLDVDSAVSNDDSSWGAVKALFQE